MIGIIKLVVWIAGILVIAHFILNYFGYEINRNYFNESKKMCLEQLDKCKTEYIEQGTKNARCDFDCVDPKLIIKLK